MKLIITLLLIVVCAVAQTPTLNLAQPTYHEKHWETPINNNWSIIDSIFPTTSCGDSSHATAWNFASKKLECQTLSTSGSVSTPLILGPNGGNYGLASYGWIQPPFANVPLFNLEQDVTTGLNTGANPSIIQAIYGGIQPSDGNGNLFGQSVAVRDEAATFDVANLGAVGGTAQWFGTSGKQAVYLYGVIGASYALGPGNVNNNWGVRALATYGAEYKLTCPTCTGHITYNRGLTAGSGGYFGTITNDVSVYVEMPATGATFTNPHIGIDIADQSVYGALPTAIDIRGAGNSTLGTLTLGGYPTGPSYNGRNFSFASGKNWTGAPANAIYTSALFIPSFSLSTPPSTGSYGIIVQPQILAGNAVDWTGKKMVGVGVSTFHQGTGTIGVIRGAEILANASFSGPVTENTAVYGVADNTGAASGSSAPNVTNQYGGYFASLNSNTHTTTTNSYGLYVAGPANTSNPITHHYGLYLADQTQGSGNADPWALYSVAGKAHFGGVIDTPRIQITLSTPAFSSDPCVAGQIWADTGYVYVCTATNQIKRAALSTF